MAESEARVGTMAPGGTEVTIRFCGLRLIQFLQTLWHITTFRLKPGSVYVMNCDREYVSRYTMSMLHIYLTKAGMKVEIAGTLDPESIKFEEKTG